MMPYISTNHIEFHHGPDELVVHLHRTLRLPEDGRTHGLPPSLGHFPLHRIEDYRSKVPAAWREHGGLFFPMWQREAMWLSFSASRRPFALKVAAGKVNAVSGREWTSDLRGTDFGLPGTDLRPQTSDPKVRSPKSEFPSEVRGPRSDVHPTQDYLVVPPQPWLDGFNSGAGKIRQFVSMPLGMGYTVEGQVTGKEDVGGIQLLAIPPKNGMLEPQPKPAFRGGQFLRGGSPAYGMGGLKHTLSTNSVGWPDLSREYSESSMDSFSANIGASSKAAEMGLAQGGEMEQKIYPDPYGVDVWMQEAGQRLFLHIVNSELYEQITGEKPPRSPVTAQHYAAKGWPWYELWDQEMGDVPASPVLSGVKTVGQKDESHGFSGQQDDSPVHESVASAGVISPGPQIKEGSEWK